MDRLSKRILKAKGSITLEINEKIQAYKKQGRDIFNLTAGQLPFRPEANFIQSLQGQLSFLSSYQYSSVQGLADLQEKNLERFLESRFPSWSKNEKDEFSVKQSILISHGSKHSLHNAFASILNEGDEVILFAPYWVSFPEMITFWGGIPRIVECHHFDGFSPDLEHLKEVLEQNTIKAIVINSPNNPTGVHYSEVWMKQFAEIVSAYPEIVLISDEIYEQLYYYDPAPTYFYQYESKLLERTIVINGISKSLAATGLRIGTAIGPKVIIDAMTKLQSQSTSGANSLVQNALNDYDDRQLRPYLQEIRLQLRRNAEILKDILREYDLATCWYQTTSAYYYIIDFMRTPYFKKRFAQASRQEDKAKDICERLLEEQNVAIIPGTNFGAPNCARLSFTLDPELFEQACKRIALFLKD
jgi:aspartate aminotransferase